MAISSKVLLSVLLLLSVVPLLFAPKVNSQQYTTITTFTTQTVTAATTLVTKSLATTTVTPWGGGFSISSDVEPLHSGRCNLHVVNIYGAIAGDIMTGTFTAEPTAVTLYISNYQQAIDYAVAMVRYGQNHQNPDPCTFAPEHLLKVDNVKSYSFNFAVPADDQYILEFFNYNNPSSKVTVGLMVYLEHASLQSNTVTQSVTATQTSTFFKTIEIPFFQAKAGWIIPVALILVLAIVVLVLRSRRAKSTKSSKTMEKEEEITEKRFCISCGAELPLRSEFCSKCGSSQ